MQAFAQRDFKLNGKRVDKGAAVELAVEQFRDLEKVGFVGIVPPARVSRSKPRPKPS